MRNIVEELAVAMVMLDDEFSDLQTITAMLEHLGKLAPLAQEEPLGKLAALVEALDGVCTSALLGSLDDAGKSYEAVNEGIRGLQAAVEEHLNQGAVKMDVNPLLRTLGAEEISAEAPPQAEAVIDADNTAPEEDEDHAFTMEEVEAEIKRLTSGVDEPEEVLEADGPASSAEEAAEQAPPEDSPPRAEATAAETLASISPEIAEDPSVFFEFIEEANSQLEDVESSVLALEENPGDRDLVNEIFRPVHSIKGSAGFLGLADVNHLAHDLENMLDLARKGKIEITERETDVMLHVLDTLKKLLENIATRADRCLNAGGEGVAEMETIDIAPSIAMITDAIEAASGGAPAGAQSADQAAPPPDAPGDNAPEQEAAGEDEEPLRIGESLVKSGKITEDQLEQAVSTQEKPLGELLVEQGAITQQEVDKALEVQRRAGGGPSKRREAIRVDTDRLDALVDLVGELVISYSQVNQSLSSLSAGNGAGEAAMKNIAHFGKITKGLQDQVMTLRMIPIKQTFQKMQRLVRDLAHRGGKTIKLHLHGEETELDKNVIEEINDPLVHLVRNSVDHGLETPAERLEAGKPEEGSVHLRAYHQGGNIIIEISPRKDTGQGPQAGIGGKPRRPFGPPDIQSYFPAGLFHGREDLGNIRAWRGARRGAPQRGENRRPGGGVHHAGARHRLFGKAAADPRHNRRHGRSRGLGEIHYPHRLHHRVHTAPEKNAQHRGPAG